MILRSFHHPKTISQKIEAAKKIAIALEKESAQEFTF
jgi:hypothetical protein